MCWRPIFIGLFRHFSWPPERSLSFIEEGTLYLFARLFYRLTRRRHFSADAKRGCKAGIMRDELDGMFLIKKQPLMILAIIVFFAI